MRRIVVIVVALTLTAGCGANTARPFGGEPPGGSGAQSGGTGSSSGGRGGSAAAPGTGGLGAAATGGHGTGGMAATTGTGGASTVQAGPLTVKSGFATNGVWSGYGYTATTGTGATISPVCPTPCFTGMTNLCVTGTVAANSVVGSSTAVLGWNINQMMTTAKEASPVHTVTTSGTGLAITLSSGVTGGRVQLEDTAAVPNRWCANLTAPSMMIPWSAFTTNCESATGVASPYTVGTPIASIQIVVPGNTAALASFRFCLDNARQY